ncbi:MAG: CRISPR-associated endonuclease Cas3'' [Desulfarculaceae bacterium]|nr:CRISPR-associated endonuclease Cas3'' [Desulfarculaceae bacterium]MCF8047767.1 CRISPR-associated endonuclease Cas3'' [Desulfarculaceae bacterium]
MSQFMAHSTAESGYWHPLKDHLTGVAELASSFASAFGAEQEARLAGLLHDLGKYGHLFRKRLENPRQYKKIDHWTLGAWAVAQYYRRAAAACLASAGHHLGLPQFDQDTSSRLNPANYDQSQRRLSEQNLDLLLALQRDDGIELPPPVGFRGEIGGVRLSEIKPAALMLDYRMLFSALVDADFLDTEAHFKRGPDGVKRLRPAGPPLEPAWALEVLLDHIQELASASNSSEDVNQLRADLLQACLTSAESSPGLFTLSAPTGSGKTLAMLAFALKHAERHGLRRVVMVIPYLSIIEQTALVYRELFAPHLPEGTLPEHYVLEHHSMAGLRENDSEEDEQSPQELRRRELCENWDAPLIVTTSIQMLESLFSHRPGACRKLHRLAGSVILFDEVQTLPTHLAAATLAGLSRMSRRFGSSVVLSTATQPAFEALSDKVRSLGSEPWAPREIAPAKLGLFKRVERVKVAWPQPDEALSPAQVSAELARPENHRSLCVVNLKRQARDILRELTVLGAGGLFHLSTSMCPAHRQEVLAQVRELLRDPAQPPVRLVSTQCVEAGVDLDFPVVWRAWGPLTAIAQAAGRCNRNGNLAKGRVRVFQLQQEYTDAGKPRKNYPDDTYAQAAEAAKVILARIEADNMDIEEPEVFRAFYRQVYAVQGAANPANETKLEDAIRRHHFEEVAQLYRLIDQDAINILTPYDPAAFQELAQQARDQGLTRDWVAKARPYTVGWFRPREDSQLMLALEPIPILGKGHKRHGGMSPDWFICPAEAEMYDQVMGFDEQKIGELLVF